MTTRPELKQFGDLTIEDFERHAVWVACHVEDYGEPYETDEETFRPWGGPLPVSGVRGMFLVRSVARLADGMVLPGFLTPSSEPNDLGVMQPHVFVGGRQFGFWGGMIGVSDAERDDLRRSLGKQSSDVFPLIVVADPDLAGDHALAEVTGWS